MEGSKCLISVFFAMILCGAAVAVERFELLPCNEGGSRGMLCCTEYDSVSDVSYLHDNITRRITVKLQLPVLSQLWNNQGEIFIVTPNGDVINNGQELIRSEDRDRWTITFTFQHVNSDFGKLHLDFHIKDVKYTDEQLLHVEIRMEDNIFATRGKSWFPVDDPEGETTTTENPAEDPSAILHERIETLQNEKEALQEEKMTAENASLHYQTKYYHCLEVKNDLEGSTKPEIKGAGHISITSVTLFFVILEGIVLAYLAYHKLVHVSNGLTLSNPTSASYTIESYDKSHTSSASSLQQLACEA